MSATTLPPIGGLAGHLTSLRSLRPKWWLAALAVLLIAALLAAAVLRTHASTQYATQPVATQTLVQSVTASGTVNPQNNISVGTQVSGTIASIAVDFNSKVTRGEVLARLDPSTFQAQLDQAEANLAQARAQAAQAQANAGSASSAVSVADANTAAGQAAVNAAQANVTKLQAALDLAQKTQARDAALLAQGYVAQSTADTDRSNTAQAQADVASAQAAVAQAQAQMRASSATIDQNGSTAQGDAAAADAAQAAIASAQAVVEQDQLNLNHSVITSPVDGTVVARDVSVGQTVAASLQTPTLFAIAQNLGKMEVDINVGEPDIGNVRAGDAVQFSVLAYPNRTFGGTVSQVRINPQTVNNVVTYDVVVLANNTDGALLPGMTANATIDVASTKDALTVPLAALQWKPNARQSAANAAGTAAGQTAWGAVNGSSATGVITGGSQSSLFIDRNGRPVRVAVHVGLLTSTQAAVTPVTAGQLAAGDPVIVGSSGATSHAAGAQRSPMSATPASGASMRGIH